MKQKHVETSNCFAVHNGLTLKRYTTEFFPANISPDIKNAVIYLTILDELWVVDFESGKKTELIPFNEKKKGNDEEEDSEEDEDEYKKIQNQRYYYDYHEVSSDIVYEHRGLIGTMEVNSKFVTFWDTETLESPFQLRHLIKESFYPSRAIQYDEDRILFKDLMTATLCMYNVAQMKQEKCYMFKLKYLKDIQRIPGTSRLILTDEDIIHIADLEQQKVLQSFHIHNTFAPGVVLLKNNLFVACSSSKLYTGDLTKKSELKETKMKRKHYFTIEEFNKDLVVVPQSGDLYNVFTNETFSMDKYEYVDTAKREAFDTENSRVRFSLHVLNHSLLLKNGSKFEVLQVTGSGNRQSIDVETLVSMDDITEYRVNSCLLRFKPPATIFQTFNQRLSDIRINFSK